MKKWSLLFLLSPVLVLVGIISGCDYRSPKSFEERVQDKDQTMVFLGKGVFERVEYVGQHGRTIFYFSNGSTIAVPIMISVSCVKGDSIEVWRNNEIVDDEYRTKSYYVRVVNPESPK